MDRRSLLRALAAGGVTALAGCTGAASTPGTDAAGRGEAATERVTEVPLAELGTPPDICDEPVREAPGIYAVTDPRFAADWSDHEVGVPYRRRDADGLVDEQTVIGLEADGRARAYPLSVLYYHEVVNDDFGGPVLVTYCPLCRSGVVADRTVDGEPTAFGVTGLLWRPPREYTAGAEARESTFGVSRDGPTGVSNNGNLVMFDHATGSYWSQVLAEAICGPRRGEQLSIRPSSVATWGEWREARPETDVLLPPPHSTVAEPPIGR